MDKSESGNLQIDGDDIVYDSSQYGSWRLAISDIYVIGEYTNQYGPVLDDYFFVFVAEIDGSWYEASFYAEGSDAFLEQLGAKIHVDPTCSLIGSTDFKSNVWFPEELAGMPLFEFKNEGILGKLGLRNKQYLAPSVIEHIKKVKGSQPSSAKG
jgi:hypothetical protein